MSYWKSQQPTPNQLSAIATYNKAYGVEIVINNKQDAHDVISKFCPVQKLDFNDSFIEGTSVKYNIIDNDKFNQYKSLNHERLKYVESIEIKDGQAIIAIRKKSNNHLQSLNDIMFRMLNEESFSEFEDDLGYLDQETLRREKDIYGIDPLLNGDF